VADSGADCDVFGLHKTRRISGLTNRLITSQEGLQPTELANYIRRLYTVKSLQYSVIEMPSLNNLGLTIYL